MQPQPIIVFIGWTWQCLRSFSLLRINPSWINQQIFEWLVLRILNHSTDNLFCSPACHSPVLDGRIALSTRSLSSALLINTAIFMEMPGIEPRAAGCEAWTLLLSYATSHQLTTFSLSNLELIPGIVLHYTNCSWSVSYNTWQVTLWCSSSFHFMNEAKVLKA